MDDLLHEPPPQSTQWQATETYEQNVISGKKKDQTEKLDANSCIWQLPSNIDAFAFLAFSWTGEGALEQEWSRVPT